MEDYVQSYIKAVESGRIKVPKTIHKLIKRHQKDLEEGIYIYDLTQAERVIKFIELLPDLKTGKPTKLALFQKFIICMIYGWQKQDGKRRFQKVFITMARKQGKSILVSGIALFEMIYAESPKLDRQIFCSANTSQQARIVFNMITKQLNRIREKSKAIRKQTHITQNGIFYKDEAFIKPLSSNTSALDGFNPLIAILDEYAYTPEKSEMMSVLESGQAQQEEPLTVIISTAGTDLSVPMYQKELPKARKVLDGQLDDEGANAYLPIIYEQDSEDELKDEDLWIKSNPLLEVEAMHDLMKKNLRVQYQNAKAMGNLTETLTKNFNFWVSGKVDSFVDMNKWYASSRNALNLPMPNVHGRKVYIGIDLSARGDLSSLTWVIPIEEERRLFVDSFSFVGFNHSIEEKIKSEGVDYKALEMQGYCSITKKESGFVDYTEIVAFIHNLIEVNSFNLQGIFYDPYSMQTVITELEEDYGNLLIEVRQGYQTLSSPIQKLRTDIEEGFIYHNDNPILTKAIENAELIENNNALMIRKRNKDFRNKIDALASLINTYVEVQFEDFEEGEDLNEYFNGNDFNIFA